MCGLTAASVLRMSASAFETRHGPLPSPFHRERARASKREQEKERESERERKRKRSSFRTFSAEHSTPNSNPNLFNPEPTPKILNPTPEGKKVRLLKQLSNPPKGRFPGGGSRPGPCRHSSNIDTKSPKQVNSYQRLIKLTRNSALLKGNHDLAALTNPPPKGEFVQAADQDRTERRVTRGGGRGGCGGQRADHCRCRHTGGQPDQPCIDPSCLLPTPEIPDPRS